jgi:hypothetical protein
LPASFVSSLMDKRWSTEMLRAATCPSAALCAASLAAEVMKCRLFLGGTFERGL